MPVWILVTVPLGVVAVVLLVYFTNRHHSQTHFESLAQARERLLLDEPSWRPTDAVLAEDGRAALFWHADQKRLAVVHSFAAHSVTRLLTNADLKDSRLAADGRLLLRLRDFAAPRLAIVLPSNDAERWHSRVQNLTS